MIENLHKLLDLKLVPTRWQVGGCTWSAAVRVGGPTSILEAEMRSQAREVCAFLLLATHLLHTCTVLTELSLSRHTLLLP